MAWVIVRFIVMATVIVRVTFIYQKISNKLPDDHKISVFVSRCVDLGRG